MYVVYDFDLYYEVFEILWNSENFMFELYLFLCMNFVFFFSICFVGEWLFVFKCFDCYVFLVIYDGYLNGVFFIMIIIKEYLY